MRRTLDLSKQFCLVKDKQPVQILKTNLNNGVPYLAVVHYPSTDIVIRLTEHGDGYSCEGFRNQDYDVENADG